MFRARTLWFFCDELRKEVRLDFLTVFLGEMCSTVYGTTFCLFRTTVSGSGAEDRRISSLNTGTVEEK